MKERTPATDAVQGLKTVSPTFKSLDLDLSDLFEKKEEKEENNNLPKMSSDLGTIPKDEFQYEISDISDLYEKQSEKLPDARLDPNYSETEELQQYPLNLRDFSEINEYFTQIYGNSAVRLPEPDLDMYEDLKTEFSLLPKLERNYFSKSGERLRRKAKQRYDAFAADPKAQRGSVGQLLYPGADGKLRVVPPFSQDLLTGNVDAGIPLVPGTNIDFLGAGQTAYTAGSFGYGAARDALELGAAAIDQIAEETTGKPLDLVQKVEQIADTEGGDRLYNNLVGSAAGLSLGLGTSQILINSLPKLANKVPKLASFLSTAGKVPGLTTAGKTASTALKAATYEAGITAFAPTDSTTLAIGENALLSIPLMKDIGKDISPDDPEYTKILKRRRNIFYDALVLSGVADRGVKLVPYVASLVAKAASPVGFMLSKGASDKFQTDTIANDIVETLIAGDNTIGKQGKFGLGADDLGVATEKQRIAFVKDLAKMIREGADLQIDVPFSEIADINTEVGTLVALNRYLENNNLGDAGKLLQQRISTLRRVGSGIGARTQLKDQTPALESARVLGEIEQLKGNVSPIEADPATLQEMKDIGIDIDKLELSKSPEGLATPKTDLPAIDYATDTLQVDTQEFLKDLGKQKDTLNLQLADLDANIDSIVRNGDPRLGATIFAKLQNLRTVAGYPPISDPSRISADSIRDQIAVISGKMDAEKNRLFNEVQGGEVDSEALIDIILRLAPDPKRLTVLQMPNNPYFTKLLTEINITAADLKNLKKAQKKDPSIEINDIIKDRFEKSKIYEDLDFSRLYTEIRPSLSSSISLLLREPTVEAGNTAKILRTFRDYIDTDAINYVRQTGDDAVVDAANTAMEYYTKSWSPYWKEETVLSDIGDLRRQTIAKNMKRTEFEDKGREAVKNGFREQNVAVGFKIIDLLNEESVSAKSVIDYFVGELFKKEKVRNKLLTEQGFKDFKESDVLTSLGTYATFLKEKFPAEAKSLENLRRSLNLKSSTRETLNTKIKKIEEDYDLAQKQIYDTELKALFDTTSEKNIPGSVAATRPKSNSYASLATLFSDKTNGVDALARLMSKINKQNKLVAKAGIQAAFARWLRSPESKIFIADTATFGAPILSKTGIAQRELDISDVFTKTRIVFDDKPEFEFTLRRMLEETGAIQKSSSAKSLPGESQTFPLLEQQKKLDAGITQVFGVLNRWGARGRILGKARLATMLNTTKHEQIKDYLLSEPDAFIEALNNIVKVKEGKLRADNRELAKFFTRALLYREDPPTEEEKDYKFFLEMIENRDNLSEKDFNKLSPKSNANEVEDSVDTQMEEMFN